MKGIQASPENYAQFSDDDRLPGHRFGARIVLWSAERRKVCDVKKAGTVRRS